MYTCTYIPQYYERTQARTHKCTHTHTRIFIFACSYLRPVLLHTDYILLNRSVSQLNELLNGWKADEAAWTARHT